MLFALLSRRFRSWLLLVLVLPLFGRVLETLGVRVGTTKPRAGDAMTGLGQRLQHRGRRRRY
ncbi:MAG: hypothetical protein LC789_07905 [Actinobacteria bacterium]|nr:hypothetical protein [Actinomycetota bacterium]MCA1719643.1 hypothetical protein [Actinomycetota bacterium]